MDMNMRTIIMILMLIIYYRIKKNNNEYVIRYIDVNKSIIAPLKIKIKNSLDDIHKLKNNIALVSLQSDDKKTF